MGEGLEFPGSDWTPRTFPVPKVELPQTAHKPFITPATDLPSGVGI